MDIEAWNKEMSGFVYPCTTPNGVYTSGCAITNTTDDKDDCIVGKDRTAKVNHLAEPDRKFLEIVAEYPKICTYPEYEGKPYYSIKYEENGETIVGFSTYKPEVLSQYLKDYFIKSAEPERTAKVEDIQVEFGDDEYVNDRLGDMYHYGNCGNCGETVSHNQKYCHECGSKLEWNE